VGFLGCVLIRSAAGISPNRTYLGAAKENLVSACTISVAFGVDGKGKENRDYAG
jgi:hypothetical protein